MTRPLTPEEAKLQLLALDAREHARAAARPPGPIGWIMAHPCQAAAAGLGAALLIRALRPRRPVVRVEKEGAVAATARGGLIAAALAYLGRQFVNRYLLEFLLTQARRYSPRAHRTTRAGPDGTTWEPDGRPSAARG